MSAPAPRVALFVTCLADLMRPSVAFSAIKLLQQAGCEVEVPRNQTCCGQPAYNTGAYKDTRPVARNVIKTFAGYQYVVAPSGSCAGMIRHHYPRLFEKQPAWREKAGELAERTWELTSFLVDVMDFRPDSCAAADDERKLTYHDSCAGLREMGVKQQPRRLLLDMCGIDVTEMRDSEVCCGFGGTFCVKMPELSGKMVDDKIDNACASEASLLVGGDLGCLLNISGRASRRGVELEVRHVAEVLAKAPDSPAIGEGGK